MPLSSVMFAPSSNSFVARTKQAAADAQNFLGEALKRFRKTVVQDGVISSSLMEMHQHQAHALAWAATYVEAIREMAAYAERMEQGGIFHEMEQLLIHIGMGEYCDQLLSGIMMSQQEIARPSSLGFAASELSHWRTPALHQVICEGNTAQNRARLVDLILQARGTLTYGNAGLDDMLDAVRDEMHRFSANEVSSRAHHWHLNNDYIPLDVIDKMAELGVFGLTIPENYGGLGLSKVAMCVVSEELSRGYIGVGSLGTRSEIAAELILAGGTEAQKAKFLPALASGEILPTAVFTEPNTGSDLASLTTRAVREGDVWKVYGNKTWITHPVRADLMTMLVRTNDAPGYKGLSMLLAQKPRGTDETPFPVYGLTGGEIEVLGYRGMKEYELAFDGFEVPYDNLLGGVEGQGFKQLMQTFEAARIQTAARAVGIAQSALDIGLTYALERHQFGKPLIAFARVADKIAMMAVETHIARLLACFSGRIKDEERRCDLEAGMAKLLAARVAWASADNALQIHGGNGFALEYQISRILCDARVLSIFEGAAEIQANVIARRLLDIN